MDFFISSSRTTNFGRKFWPCSKNVALYIEIKPEAGRCQPNWIFTGLLHHSIYHLFPKGFTKFTYISSFAIASIFNGDVCPNGMIIKVWLVLNAYHRFVSTREQQDLQHPCQEGANQMRSTELWITSKQKNCSNPQPHCEWFLRFSSSSCEEIFYEGKQVLWALQNRTAERFFLVYKRKQARGIRLPWKPGQQASESLRNRIACSDS